MKTGADTSFGSLSTQTLPNGQTTQTALVMGIRGTLSVAAVATGPDVTRAAADDLANIVDDALARG